MHNHESQPPVMYILGRNRDENKGLWTGDQFVHFTSQSPKCSCSGLSSLMQTKSPKCPLPSLHSNITFASLKYPSNSEHGLYRALSLSRSSITKMLKCCLFVDLMVTVTFFIRLSFSCALLTCDQSAVVMDPRSKGLY